MDARVLRRTPGISIQGENLRRYGRAFWPNYARSKGIHFRTIQATPDLSDPAGGAEGRDLIIGEDAGADEEADAFGVVEGELATAAGDYVERELGMLPVFELALAHVERLAVNFAQLHVRVADEKLAARIAHGGAAVAAASGLVEHEGAVLFAQYADEMNGEISGEDLFGCLGHEGTISASQGAGEPAG
jgi:hypothetical protein